ncbi:MAG TPA: carboxypeptidase-like regulatory domain-containing protein, partial [Gemmatimonadaceae bacterium]
MRGRFLIGLVVCAQAVNAQTPGTELKVRIESNAGVAISGALVALVDAAGNAATEVVTRADGRRTLTAPPGTYHVRVRRIGYRPFVSGDVTLPQKNADELVLRAETDRIMLATIVVSAKSDCGVINSDAPALSAVWEEIAKALTASQLTIRDLQGIGFARKFRRQTDTHG